MNATVPALYSLPVPLNMGDLVICGGHSMVSKVIRLFTDRSNRRISHCGVMLHNNTIAQSTSLEGSNGVSIRPFDQWLNEYPGEVWIKYLTKSAQNSFDAKRFEQFILSQDGMPYDKTQAFFAAFGLNSPDSWGSAKWYCSELATAAYKEAGIVPVNYASGVTPASIMHFPIFEKRAWQMKGSPKELK